EASVKLFCEPGRALVPKAKTLSREREEEREWAQYDNGPKCEPRRHDNQSDQERKELCRRSKRTEQAFIDSTLDIPYSNYESRMRLDCAIRIVSVAQYRVGHFEPHGIAHAKRGSFSPVFRKASGGSLDDRGNQPDRA